jgi:hypothetical protein
MVAVLEDAIALHFKRIPPGTTKLRPNLLQEQGQADHWLRSDDRVSAFSFLRICEAVNLDPQYVRDGLHMLHEQTVTDGRHPRTWKGDRRPHSRRGSPGCALTTPVEHHSEERSIPTANGSSGAKARKQVSGRLAEMGSEIDHFDLRVRRCVQERPSRAAITTRPAQ